MGNFDSRAKFEHGQMMLQLDKPHGISGQYLTGKILLELSQPYPGVAVTVSLKGTEYYYWRHGKHDNPHRDPNHAYIKKAVTEY